MRAGAHPVALDEIDFVQQAGFLFIEDAFVIFPALLALQQVGL